jgi:hypothetical protein
MKYSAILFRLTILVPFSGVALASSIPREPFFLANYGENWGYEILRPDHNCNFIISKAPGKNWKLSVINGSENVGAIYPGTGGWSLETKKWILTFKDNEPSGKDSIRLFFGPERAHPILKSITSFRGHSNTCLY